MPTRLLAAIAAIFLAYMYMKYGPFFVSNIDNVKQEIIKTWDAEITLPDTPFESVSVGVNADVDVIVRATDLLRALKIAPSKSGQDHAVLRSVKDLEEAFVHFFSKGAGVERSFSNHESFAPLVKAAESLLGTEYYIGGNAALMAEKIVSTFPSTKVQLVGPVGPKLKTLLHTGLSVPEKSFVKEDEYHMILEYSVGETWGMHTAPIATRFITSFDEANGKVTLLETFFESLQTFKTDLVILSGLHMLDGHDEAVWKPRVAVLQKYLTKLPPSLPLHLELASMSNPTFLKHIVANVLSGVSSLGLNEQELAFTSFVGQGPHAELHERGKQPPIHMVTDIMLWILRTYGHSPQHPTSRLTRVHFHSLQFHIIGVVPGAWDNIYSSVAAGTRVAGQQACNVTMVMPNEVKIMIPGAFALHSGGEQIVFNASKPVMPFEKEGYEFVFSPVLVCKKPVKTVGLGDAISSTGLLYSSYNKQFGTSNIKVSGS